MNPPNIEAMATLAASLVARARRQALDALGQGPVTLKQDGSVVTPADMAIERMIVEHIERAYPDHAIIGEEASAPGATPQTPQTSAVGHGEKRRSRPDPAEARFVWVIDPIDGTRNYAVSFPFFATSIGVLDRGMPVVGVVGEHVSGQVYVAVAGGGTRRGDDRVHVVDAAGVSKRLIGIPSSASPRMAERFAEWLARPGWVLRNTGSAAMHLALVSSGALQACYCSQSKIWDIAAGALLVTEAGGRITAPDGRDLFPWDPSGPPEANLPCVAGAPVTHAELSRDFRAD